MKELNYYLCCNKGIFFLEIRIYCIMVRFFFFRVNLIWLIVGYEEIRVGNMI